LLLREYHPDELFVHQIALLLVEGQYALENVFLEEDLRFHLDGQFCEALVHAFEQVLLNVAVRILVRHHEFEQEVVLEVGLHADVVEHLFELVLDVCTQEGLRDVFKRGLLPLRVPELLQLVPQSLLVALLHVALHHPVVLLTQLDALLQFDESNHIRLVHHYFTGVFVLLDVVDLEIQLHVDVFSELLLNEVVHKNVEILQHHK